MLALILHLFDHSGISASCFLSPPIRNGGAESKPRPLFSLCVLGSWNILFTTAGQPVALLYPSQYEQQKTPNCWQSGV